jgi:outer membrane immunogenic protein
MNKYLLLAAVFIAQPALAQQDDEVTYTRNGTRIEVRAGYETPTASAGTIYKIGNSASIGGEIGYDFAVGHDVTLGTFANYEYAHTSDCYAGLCIGAKGNVQAGLRAGLNIGKRAQLYAKGGYDSFTLYASSDGYEAAMALHGPMGAIGVDYNITKRAYIGFEVNYADLGKLDGIDIARRHVAVTVGTHL